MADSNQKYPAVSATSEDTLNNRIDLKGCSSCGADHTDIPLLKMAKAVTYEGRYFTHCASCPKTEDVILVEIL